jgi:hypothetical protein
MERPSALAYAWETNPFREYLGASIYAANDTFPLPALPWKCKIEYDDNTNIIKDCIIG